jgi:hypothetical protein
MGLGVECDDVVAGKSAGRIDHLGVRNDTVRLDRIHDGPDQRGTEERVFTTASHNTQNTTKKERLRGVLWK